MNSTNDSAIVGTGTHDGQPVRPDVPVLSPVDFADLPDPELSAEVPDG